MNIDDIKRALREQMLFNDILDAETITRMVEVKKTELAEDPEFCEAVCNKISTKEGKKLLYYALEESFVGGGMRVAIKSEFDDEIENLVEMFSDYENAGTMPGPFTPGKGAVPIFKKAVA